jgi:hypothetical protein
MLAVVLAASLALTGVGLVTAASTPSAPTDVVIGAGDGTVEVAWLPGDDGDSPVTAYHVSVEPGGHGVDVGGDATHASVGGLPNGVAVTATVTATNALGTGSASAASAAVTPAAGAFPPSARAIRGTGLVTVGGSLVSSTDPAATSAQGQASLGIAVTLVETAPTIALPAGVLRLGEQVEVTGLTGTVDDPVRVNVNFRDDALQGRHGSGLRVFDEAGGDVPTCTSGDRAIPDPCVAYRWPEADEIWWSTGGGVQILSTASHTFAFGFGPDATAPTVTITTPAVDARYSRGQVVYADYSCADEPGGSGIAACVGSDDLDNSFPDGRRLPAYEENRIIVVGIDHDGNRTIVEHYYRYVDDIDETFTGPITLSTDPGGLGASIDRPITTTLSTPPTTTSGHVVLDQLSVPDPISGYELLGEYMRIEAELEPLPTSTQPMAVEFHIDAPLIPEGVDAMDVEVLRNGIAISACPGSSVAVPDPCVTSQGLIGNDLVIRVLTSAASYWTFGVRTVVPFAFDGFYQPVDDDPVAGNLPLNTVKAGAAVPVKFSLGGDQGSAIFETRSPSSRRIDCSSAAPVDAIEQTVSAGGSSLAFDAATGIYTYVWKTDKTWAKAPNGPCRQLSVTLTDGSVHVANFKFH